MNIFKNYSVSCEMEQEERSSSFTIEPRSIPVTKEKAVRTEKRQNTSDNGIAVCFFIQSGSVMPEKPSVIQETVLGSDKWVGRVIEVNRDTAVIEARNVHNPQTRLKLRVKKAIIEGDIERLDKRSNVVVSYTKVRNYHGDIEKRVSIRLKEPADIPVEIQEREFEAKMKHFSYMFSEE